MIWSCTLYGKPLQKRAHKTTRFNHYYDPDAPIKRQLSSWISENIQLPEKPFDGPVEITINSWFQLPTSISKAEKSTRLKGRYCWQKKIDRDNIAKIYQDILCHGQLEGKIMVDDKIICAGHDYKYWTENEEKVIITLVSLNPNWEE